MKRLILATGGVLACACAHAGRLPIVAVSVPAGSLAAAAVSIGTQANVSIGIADPALAAISVAALHGRFTVAQALRRLLDGSGADVEAIDDRTFRIVRARRVPPMPKPALLDNGSPTDIVVSASKRSTPLRDYPGSVVIDTSTVTAGETARGTDALVATNPILSSTHLGPGRNKVFIRGIADSSFNGPSQSTVGEYLGEVRLNYNAPDPDLELHDVASVEILEGPQGTLYGAGSLGGVLRLVPVSPDLTHAGGSVAAGGALVAHGALDRDEALVGNIPIVEGRLGIRAVAYESVDGGYVDDPSRALTDINRTETYGGRATLRFVPTADWTIDLGGAIQNISSRDGQYTVRGLPPLTRDSIIAQPFDNDYSLASLVVRHDAGPVRFVTATSAVFHDVGSVFDASPSAAQPTRYAEDNDILLVSNETRLSRQDANGGGWVIGMEALHTSSRIRRTLGAVGSEPSIAGTLNTVEEAALYGEATLALTGHLLATAGGRVAYDHLVGQVKDESERQPEIRRSQVFALPSIGLLWKAGELTFYTRYQKGYRPGGLSVQSDETQRFEADSVSTIELGVRYGTAGDRLSATVAASYAIWNDIQADLVDAQGLPYTTNIGSGRVSAIEARAVWRPIARLSIEPSLLASRSRLRDPAAAFVGERDATLPNIPDLVARIGSRYTMVLGGRQVALTASAAYVGRSKLGVGPALDIPQGHYLDLDAGLVVPLGPLSASVDATNLANARRNIFSLGNPFGVLDRNQTTPLRPRTIRIGLALPF